MNAWKSFWQRFLSPMTARFILALLALVFSAGGTFQLMLHGLDADAEQAVIFALGQLFGLALLAFGYYFGSTARGDDKPVEAKIVNPPSDPANVSDVDTPEGETP